METRWLMNFLWDGCVAALASLSLGRVRPLGALAAAAVGATAACLPHPRLWAAAAPGLMALLAARGRRAGALWVRMWIFAGLLGGISALAARILEPGPRALVSIGAGWAAAMAMRGGRVYADRVRLRLTRGKKEMTLWALVDTGNRLREPLGGLPVLVVERRLAEALLMEGEKPDDLPPGFRLVAFGGVGGEGKMPCFLPDRIQVFRRGRWRDAPDAWAALYPGKLPGEARALAPGELAR